jgi:exopolysaccharide biosynthesis polyprenyl glycosylphosphotransferase
MSIAEPQPSVELLEELLRDPARGQPARRVRLLRRRLQSGLRVTELFAGALAGLVLGLVARASELETVIAIVVFAIGWRLLGTVSGLAADDDARPWTSTVPKVKTTAIIALVASWLALGALSILGQPHAAPAALAAGVTAALVSLAGRGVVQSLVFRSEDLRQRTIIIGSGMVAHKIVERVKLAPHLTLDTIGLVDDDVHLESSPELPRLGGLDELERIIHEHDVDRAIIAFSKAGHDDLLRCIRVCWDNRVAIDIVPRLFEFLDGARSIEQVGGMPMLAITVPQLSSAARATKRVTDIVLSTVALVVLSPLLLACALAIKLGSRGPVFFRQPRVGRNGEIFHIYKFRSMFVDADERKREYDALNDATDGVMFKIKDDPRVTSVGRILRRFSIDELPQLINVLKGDMSLVGPRPLISEEAGAFSEAWHERRLDLRPGLTGPWQVYGRSDIPFDDMLRLDYQYVAGWSVARDFEIILATIPVVFSGRGAY